MTAALDYSELAAFYDEYCTFDGDVPFFRTLVERAGGPVLELMAGTGRLTLPLLAVRPGLHCVDSSPAMLGRLGRKVRALEHRPLLVCADVCHLPLRSRYSLVILPFQGLTELLEPADRRALFAGVAALLAPGGRFVCTTHNPAVRQRTLSADWSPVSTRRPSGGGEIRVSLRGRFDAATGTVTGQQRLELVAPDGTATERVLDLRFALPSPAEVVALAEGAGLAVLQLHGDYDGSPFDEVSSPVLVVVCERLPARR